MKEFTVTWSDRAIVELGEIVEYIEAFNPSAADKLAKRLLAVADSLANFPDRGRPSPFGSREMTNVPPYVMRYRVHADVVEIVHVRHGRRRPVD